MAVKLNTQNASAFLPSPCALRKHRQPLPHEVITGGALQHCPHLTGPPAMLWPCCLGLVLLPSGPHAGCGTCVVVAESWAVLVPVFDAENGV